MLQEIHKLNDFFPYTIFNKLLALTQSDEYWNEHGGVKGLKILATSRVKVIKEAEEYCNATFKGLGYEIYPKEENSRWGSDARLQMTPPGMEYPIHQDSEWKSITLLIYLSGEDGTYFYNAADCYKEGEVNGKRVWRCKSDPIVDTFTPNAGYWMDRSTRPHHSYINTTDTNRYVFMYNMNLPIEEG